MAQHTADGSGDDWSESLLVSSLATVENRRLGGDSQPAPISSVPLPLWWPDRRRRGWGTGSEAAVVYIPT